MAITTTPTSPAIDDATTVAASTLIGSVRVLELTSLPSESALSLGIVTLETELEITNTLQVAEADLQTSIFTPDVAGAFGVLVHDINELAAPAQTVNDRGGDRRFVYIGSEAGTVNCGTETADLAVVTTLGDGATIRLQINGSIVVAASLVATKNEKSRIATLQTVVTTALASIVGSTVAAMGTDLQTGVNALRGAYEAHRVDAVTNAHSPATGDDDTTNVVALTDADSQDGAIALLNRMRDVIVSHMTESSAAGVRWHTDDDLSSVLLTGKATDLATATVLSADLRERAYEPHRVLNTAGATNPACHPTADTTNALAAPSLLDNVITAYLDALAALNPTAPTGEPEGIQDAAHRYGFR